MFSITYSECIMNYFKLIIYISQNYVTIKIIYEKSLMRNPHINKPICLMLLNKPS